MNILTKTLIRMANCAEIQTCCRRDKSDRLLLPQNPRMPVGLLNREAITVERASALASEKVRRRQYPFEFGGGSAVQSG